MHIRASMYLRACARDDNDVKLIAVGGASTVGWVKVVTSKVKRILLCSVRRCRC